MNYYKQIQLILYVWERTEIMGKSGEIRLDDNQYLELSFQKLNKLATIEKWHSVVISILLAINTLIDEYREFSL